MPDNTDDRKRAEELVREWNNDPAGKPLDTWDEALVTRITTFASEVRAEQRERDAKIADDHHSGFECDWHEHCDVVNRIADAIRNEVEP